MGRSRLVGLLLEYPSRIYLNRSETPEWNSREKKARREERTLVPLVLSVGLCRMCIYRELAKQLFLSSPRQGHCWPFIIFVRESLRSRATDAREEIWILEKFPCACTSMGRPRQPKTSWRVEEQRTYLQNCQKESFKTIEQHRKPTCKNGQGSFPVYMQQRAFVCSSGDFYFSGLGKRRAVQVCHERKTSIGRTKKTDQYLLSTARRKTHAKDTCLGSSLVSRNDRKQEERR